MKRRCFQRGSALPETALSMGVVLLVFLGVIKLAFIGYEQSEADAVSFVAAHAGSLAKNTGNAHSRARNAVRTLFPNFKTSNLTISGLPGSSSLGSTNQNGQLAVVATLGAGGLFTNQRFGGNVFSLHSNIAEPMTATPQPAAYYYGTSTFSISANPPNCLTSNPATPSCRAVTLATPNPANSANPAYPYECRAAYYASLWPSVYTSGGSPTGVPSEFKIVTADFPSAAPSLNALQDGSGGLLAGDQDSWPTGSGNSPATDYHSMNTTTARGADIWLKTDGTAGKMLSPIFSFTSGGGPC